MAVTQDWCFVVLVGSTWFLTKDFSLQSVLLLSSHGFVVYFLQSQAKTLPHFPKYWVTGDGQQQWVSKFTDCKCLTSDNVMCYSPKKLRDCSPIAYNLLCIRKSPKPLNMVLKVVTEVYSMAEGLSKSKLYFEILPESLWLQQCPRMNQRGHPGRDAVIHEWGWLRQIQARGVPHIQSQPSAPARKGKAGGCLFRHP